MIRNCIPTRETSRPAYSRNMKELATEFTEFFMEVGVRAAEEAKRLTLVNDLPTVLHISNSLPVLYPKKMSFNFELLPLSRSIGLFSYFLQIKHPGKKNCTWHW